MSGIFHSRPGVHFPFIFFLASINGLKCPEMTRNFLTFSQLTRDVINSNKMSQNVIFQTYLWLRRKMRCCTTFFAGANGEICLF